jgi:hypothetical protein
MTSPTETNSADDPATRLLRACTDARTLPDGRTAVRFDPRRQDYDPTPDLDLLGVRFEVALKRSTDGRAWFEARFQMPPPTR